ncbi:MAG TPA: KH domain-containing protein [Myxococcaceae bacterium]
MKEVLLYIARGLVDDPDAVAVEEERGDGVVRLLLTVAADDRGKIIGRGGRTIRAIRDVVRAAATRSGVNVQVELVG